MSAESLPIIGQFEDDMEIASEAVNQFYLNGRFVSCGELAVCVSRLMKHARTSARETQGLREALEILRSDLSAAKCQLAEYEQSHSTDAQKRENDDG